MHLGLLVLRLVVGLLFVGHGAQKLFGVWGGHGLKGTAGFFESIGLKPGQLHATAAAVFEFVGGLLLALGLFTPVASLVLIATMTAAVITVHYAKGLWNTGGGYEFNLVLVASVFALAAVGPGNWSLDHALTVSDHGVLWAIGALVLGVLGGVGAVVASRLYDRPRQGVTAERPTTA
ncbi:MAG: DoxX family protein [Solirubrobacterales bacterium]|nr:DoxX family protein [Solirubrobacterales bacterium]